MDKNYELEGFLSKRLVFAVVLLLGAIIVNAVGYYVDYDNFSYFVLVLFLFGVSLRLVSKGSKGEARAA